MTTILETLQNAKINLIDNTSSEMASILGKIQLKNAVELLDKGYDLDDDVDSVLKIFAKTGNIPKKKVNHTWDNSYVHNNW